VPAAGNNRQLCRHPVKHDPTFRLDPVVDIVPVPATSLQKQLIRELCNGITRRHCL
jgi:hypothetical protein